jgi:hypothetical protein
MQSVLSVIYCCVIIIDCPIGKLEDVFTELSLAQFYELYNEMQKAKSNLEYFTV